MEGQQELEFEETQPDVGALADALWHEVQAGGLSDESLEDLAQDYAISYNAENAQRIILQLHGRLNERNGSAYVDRVLLTAFQEHYQGLEDGMST